jgi:hypothetical protein
MRKLFILSVSCTALLLVLLTACEKDFFIEVKPNKPLLVVEGYINNVLPAYNYVVLSHSQAYYSTNFQNVPVHNAGVYITEGALLQNGTYQWDAVTRTQMKEIQLPQYPAGSLPGIYFDPRLATDSTHALIGKPGKHYLLEIDAEGKQYRSVTVLLPTIPIDSLTTGFYYLDENEEDTLLKARLTVHYKDPDTVGNTQFYYWKYYSNRNDFGWGGMGTNRFTPTTDDLVNGQYIHLTHSSGFTVGDTVHYYMASVERKVYNFWDSFNKARNNGGPFATPVTLLNTVEGENVTGCFSGFSMSTKTMAIK